MALDTYSGLKTAIADHLDRSDLDSHIDDFIDVAEARHKREIRIREMLTSADLTLNEDARTIALPADFLDHKYLRVLVPDATTGCKYFPDIQELSLHELTLKSIVDQRRPRNYAIHELIEFDSEADQDYSVELFYYMELTPLSGSNASNALLARAPDVYLYGALLASAPFLLNDERIQVWGSLYTNAKDELNRSNRESKRGGPLIARIAGATP